VSTLRMWQGAGGACHVVPAFGMQLSDVDNGWHRVPGYAESSRYLVPGNVVCDQSEEWHERTGFAASLSGGRIEANCRPPQILATHNAIGAPDLLQRPCTCEPGSSPVNVSQAKGARRIALAVTLGPSYAVGANGRTSTNGSFGCLNASRYPEHKGESLT
jgi:hypothetical protein